MSPQNIVRMAKLSGLNLIAICDHNSLRQQPMLHKAAREHGIKLWYGVELQSLEEVHCLGYFKNLRQVKAMQRWIESVQDPTPNTPDYFGNQILYDSRDEILSEEPKTLILSLKAKLTACLDAIHTHQGKAVLAHIYGRQNGIVEQLGFIPPHLPIDGVEIADPRDIERFRKEYPAYRTLPVFTGSDAHQLEHIGENDFSLTEKQIRSFWRR